MAKNLDLTDGGTKRGWCRTAVCLGLRMSLVSAAALVAFTGFAPSAQAETISGEVFVKLPAPAPVLRLSGEVFVKLPPRPAGSR